MDLKRKKTMMWRWSIVSAGAIGLFWSIWYLLAGEVPVVSQIKMWPGWTISLPITLSRWWDILAGPIWTTSIILAIPRNPRDRGTNLELALIGGLTGGFVGALVNIFLGLFFGLCSGLLFSGFLGWVALLWEWEWDTNGLAVAPSFGISFGAWFGISSGLVVTLGIVLALALLIGLSASFQYLTQKGAWVIIGNWLLAKE